MRTTLNIDADVLRATKELARLEGRTIGAVISALARRSLESAHEGEPVKNCVPLMPGRPGVGIVTPDIVRNFHLDDR